jgi:hypothetical protein
VFKLAEMFVEIKGQDDPLKATIEKLKASSTGLATSLGSSISGAFSAAMGPIGLVWKAVEGLLSLVDKEGESVTQLGEYWTEAITPIKELLTGVVTSVTDWANGVVKMIKGSEQVTSAFEMLDDYASAAFESIRVAIDRGTEVFKVFWAAAQETFTGTVIILGQVYEAIMKAFGNSAVGAITSWGTVIQEWVVDKIQLVGLFVRNWPDFFEIAYIKIKQSIINVGEVMMTIPANAQIVGNYLANNWVKLVVDAFTAVGTAFSNLGTNLKNVWEAFLEFLKSGKFEVNFKPLLDGFVATADKLPELVKPKLTSLADDIAKINDRIAAREAALTKHPGKKTPAEVAAAAANAAAGPDQGFKTETFGVAEFANKIRAGILNKDSDDKVAKQLLAAERTAKATEKLAADADKPKAARVA